MPRLLPAVPAVLFFTNAFAIGALPAVNPERTVSALDLYGLPPYKRPAPAQAKPLAMTEEFLIPNRPSGDLWSNTPEIPLRMPSRSEYSVLRAADFSLPEESLDGDFFANAPTIQRPAVRQRAAAPKITRAEPAAMPMPLPEPAPRATPSDTRVTQKIIPSTIRSAPRIASVPTPMTRPARDEIDPDDEFAFKGEVPLTKLSPAQLKRAFRKTFTSENKHLSTYRIDDGFDEVSFSESAAGFESGRDLSEQSGGVRPLEIKIGFNSSESALSRDNFNLLTEYAAIVANNPKRAVQISISERGTRNFDGRKLAARRLAIIEQVLRDSGISERRIIPVLSQRNDDSFVLRVISSDTFQTLSEKRRDIFGDTTSTKTVRSLAW